ncbi:MAG: AMP-binding protein [Acidobacteriia bacterium]|nr:AMP-binding protein [Terriglobia bacterium]MBV8906869.1 AMP-binding protein [Terriglobia bacterium]
MQSYARGPRATIVRKSIGECFLETARRFPERLAIVSRQQSIRLSWAEYAHEAQRFAAGLRALGIRPGDRVGLWATNCAEWAIIQFGCALAGAILVNVNPANRSHELSFVLRKSRMRVLFLHSQDRRANYRAILEESRSGKASALEHVVYLDSPAWKEFLREPDGVETRPDPGEPANIQYTSGTTGEPKGVLLTHINLVNNGRFFAEYLRLSEQDRICVPVPLFHCFGSVIGTMAAAVTGAACIFPAATFDPLATLEAVDAERATAIYGVPAMFIAELQHPEFSRFKLKTLRTGVMAGAPCPIEIMKRVVNEMHCPQMLVAYGQTESSPGITSSRVDDDVETRCTTVGCPLPETEVRIASPSGETLPVGEHGELLARGYMVMKGYDGDPEASARAIDADGWLHTGDVAMMRPDGYFKITGRAKDMIIRGGENVYPREIEEFLHTHPAVAEAQVIGIPDERLGEAVVAWIRLKAGHAPDENEIRAFCCERLAYYKVPQHVRFVESYPMTLSGKVQKFKMRELEVASRGLEAAGARETA